MREHEKLSSMTTPIGELLTTILQRGDNEVKGGMCTEEELRRWVYYMEVIIECMDLSGELTPFTKLYQYIKTRMEEGGYPLPLNEQIEYIHAVDQTDAWVRDNA